MKVNTNNGHRKRLRERFLKSGLYGFHDYEIIELLLTLGTPRKDCKQMAKQLLDKFKDINAILDAPVEDLMMVDGIGPTNVFGIKLLSAMFEIYHKNIVEQKLKLDSADDIYLYLRNKIGTTGKEHVVILFFDTKKRLITDNVSIGTLNASLVHPREIFNKAIRYNASHIIIAHNHPSGDYTPSGEDIEITKRLIRAGKLLGIMVVDHIVVSKNGYASIRNIASEIFESYYD